MFGFVTVWVAPIFTYTRETIQFYSFCGDWFELPVREIELRASCSVICTFTNKTLILDIKSPATFSFNAQTRCTCRKTTRPLFIRQIIIITTEQLNRKDFSFFFKLLLILFQTRPENKTNLDVFCLLSLPSLSQEEYIYNAQSDTRTLG